MPIPDLTDRGLLPTGMFDCELSEIEARYVYNERRRIIWTAFSSYLPSLLLIPQVDILYVDGSFTTDREIPGDIDIIIEVDSPLVSATILARHGPMIERTWVKQTFFTDLVFEFRNSPPGRRDNRELFTEIKLADALEIGIDPTTRKGLLKVKLR